MIEHILLLDSNVISKLADDRIRRRLASNLRATGREFWPTAVNVMEALKSRDSNLRNRMLAVLAELSGDKHVFPLPTQALRTTAEAIAGQAHRLVWSEPRLTHLFRSPDSVSDTQAKEVRSHLQAQEQRFDKTHNRANEGLVPMIKELGGRDRWPNVGAFLDEVWNRRNHLEGYVSLLWEEWDLCGEPPVRDLLANRTWQLYFEGWGATLYARQLAHPQPPKVEHADLLQLVYCGPARSAILVTDDKGLVQLGMSIIDGRHSRIEVVPLETVIT